MCFAVFREGAATALFYLSMAQNISNADLLGRRAYSAPMTVKLLLTNTWCGQLTAIMWTS